MKLNFASKSILSVLLLLGSFFLSTFFVQGQITTANISGSVTDETGSPYPNAQITLTQTATGAVSKSVTNAAGAYNFTFLDPGGPYTIQITGANKQPVIYNNIFLSVSDQEVINAVLLTNVDQLEEVILSSNTIGNISKSGPSTALNKDQIATLSSVSRSIIDYTKFNSYASNVGTGLAGKDGRYNNFTLDGASLNNSFGLSSNLPGGASQPVSLDAIDQINVLIAPFDVRQSGFTSGAINVVTKKGTNEFHGSAYTFFRNENLVGTLVEDNEVNIPKSSYNTYGLTVGGPIIKNKLFFFASGEYEITNRPGVSVLPSPGSTNQSTATNNFSRTTTDDLDRVSDFLRTNYGYETGGYNIPAFPSTNYKFLGRIDWNINNMHKLMVRANYVYSANDRQLNNTSSPNPRSRSARFSRNSYSYKNSNYAQTNTVFSAVLDFKSRFSNVVSNQLLVTYSLDEQKRSTPSKEFPFVDIKQDGDNYLSFGYELFSYKNGYANPTFSIVDNITVALNNHTLTAGISYEAIQVSNSFLRYGTSYYRFSSLDDFLNNRAPEAFGLTYAYQGKDPAYTVDFGQLAAYIQDDIKLTPNFRLSVGLRIDRPIFMNELDAVPQVQELAFNNNGEEINIDLSKWPAPTTLISPRLSFNWDIVPQKLALKGGAGVFTGKVPFVWLGNQPSNSGRFINTIQLTGTNASSFLFNPDPNAYKGNFPSEPSTAVPSSISYIDPDFKSPQVMRLYIGADYKFGKGFIANVEFLYSKDINAAVVIDANQSDPNGTFLGRSAWWSPDSMTASNKLYTDQNLRRINSGIREAIMLTNTDEGGGYSITLNLKKQTLLSQTAVSRQSLFAELGYTYTNYRDIIDMPGSQLSSAYSNTAYNGRLGDPQLGYSSYSLPHRLIFFLTYKADYGKRFSTSVGLSYIGSSTGRFSYTYGNDMNGDNINNDLLYVPNDVDELQFATEEDKYKFWNFVQQDEILSANKGKTVERGAGLFPWQHQVNFRLLQDIKLNISKKVQHTIQLSFEINNLLNLFNSSWGVTQTLTNNARNPLRVNSTLTNGRPVFTYNGPDEIKTFTPLISIASTWSMNFGLRYIF